MWWGDQYDVNDSMSMRHTGSKYIRLEGDMGCDNAYRHHGCDIELTCVTDDEKRKPSIRRHEPGAKRVELRRVTFDKSVKFIERTCPRKRIDKISACSGTIPFQVVRTRISSSSKPVVPNNC